MVQRLISHSKPNNRKITQIIHKIKIQKIVQTAFSLRSKILKTFNKACTSFQIKIESSLRGNSSTNRNRETILNLFGGEQLHTNHSEPYFRDVAYDVLPKHVTIVIDENGLMHNQEVQPICDKAKGVKWSCGETCIIRESSIESVLGFLMLVSNCTSDGFLDMFGSIH